MLLLSSVPHVCRRQGVYADCFAPQRISHQPAVHLTNLYQFSVHFENRIIYFFLLFVSLPASTHTHVPTLRSIQPTRRSLAMSMWLCALIYVVCGAECCVMVCGSACVVRAHCGTGVHGPWTPHTHTHEVLALHACNRNEKIMTTGRFMRFWSANWNSIGRHGQIEGTKGGGVGCPNHKRLTGWLVVVVFFSIVF